MQAPDAKTAKTNGHARARTASSPTDEMVIHKCRAADNAAKFADLFDHGDVYAYHDGDESRADLSLLGILTFYTQDEAQLEEIFSSSALGRREKWRRRDDYRKRTIRKALADVGEVYDWVHQRSRPLVSSLSSPLGGSSDDDTSQADDDPEIVWFAELGEPKEREYLIEKIGVKGYPIVAFGAGGVAKSFAMLSAGIAVASASGDEYSSTDMFCTWTSSSTSRSNTGASATCAQDLGSRFQRSSPTSPASASPLRRPSRRRCVS